MSWLCQSRTLGILVRQSRCAELLVRSSFAPALPRELHARSACTLTAVRPFSPRQSRSLSDTERLNQGPGYGRFGDHGGMHDQHGMHIDGAVSWFDLFARLTVLQQDLRKDAFVSCLPRATQRFFQLRKEAEEGWQGAFAEMEGLFRETRFRVVTGYMMDAMVEVGADLVRSKKVSPNEIGMFLRGLSGHVPRRLTHQESYRQLQVCVDEMVERKAELSKFRQLEGLVGAARFHILDVEALMKATEDLVEDDLGSLGGMELVYLAEAYDLRLPLGRLQRAVLAEFRRRIMIMEARPCQMFLRQTHLLSLLSKDERADTLAKVDKHMASCIAGLSHRNVAMLSLTLGRLKFQPMHINFEAEMLNRMSYLDVDCFTSLFKFVTESKNCSDAVFHQSLAFMQRHTRALMPSHLNNLLRSFVSRGEPTLSPIMVDTVRFLAEEVTRRLLTHSRFPPQRAAHLFRTMAEFDALCPQVQTLSEQLRDTIVYRCLEHFPQMTSQSFNYLLRGFIMLPEIPSSYIAMLQKVLAASGSSIVPTSVIGAQQLCFNLTHLRLCDEALLRSAAGVIRSRLIPTVALDDPNSQALDSLVPVLRSLSFFKIDCPELLSETRDRVDSSISTMPADILFSAKMLTLVHSLCSLDHSPQQAVRGLLRCEPSFVAALSSDECALLRDVQEFGKCHGGASLLSQSVRDALAEKLVPQLTAACASDRVTLDGMQGLVPNDHVRGAAYTSELYRTTCSVLKSSDGTTCAWPAGAPEHLSKDDVERLCQEGKTPVAILPFSGESFVLGSAKLTGPATMACTGLQNNGWEVVTVNADDAQFASNTGGVLTAELAKVGVTVSAE